MTDPSLMQVWKFEIEIEDSYVVMMPSGAKMVAVGKQRSGSICLWAMVHPSAVRVPRVFFIRGTGHPLGESSEKPYIGIVFDGPFVRHVFGDN